MSNRSTLIAAAMVAGCASIFIISASVSPAHAEDECLSAPKATTPAGSHWYYRLEKGTKRKCWYLGDAGAKVNKGAAPKTAAANEDDAPRANAAMHPKMQPSVANARAELAPAQSAEDSALTETTWPPLTEASADAPASPPTQASAADNSGQEHSNVAPHWPEPGAASLQNAQQSPQQPAPQPAPALTSDRLAAAAAAPTTPATVGAPAAASADETSDSVVSFEVVSSVLAGLLALAAIVGPLLLKYFGPRRRNQPLSNNGRRPIWGVETRDIYEPHPQAYTARHPQDFDTDMDVNADDRSREVERLLARASRRSAA